MKRWLADISLVTVAVCLFLPVYINDSQYAREHADAGRALDEANASAGTNYEKYSQIFAEKRQGHKSPEFYYRRREEWASRTFWLFLIPLVAGLAYRRWVACAIVVIFWALSSYLQGVRY
jgi:hypothetical protein